MTLRAFCAVCVLSGESTKVDSPLFTLFLDLFFFFFVILYNQGGDKMAYRKQMKGSKDKKVFTNTAKKTKDINVRPKASRGGVRL